MIEIYPHMILSEKEAEKSGFKQKEENTVYMVATDSTELIGIGKMRLFGSYAEFSDVFIAEETFSVLAHGIGKAMLNFIERREIYDVISRNEKIADLLKLLRFKKTNEIQIGGNLEKNIFKNVFYVNLEGYFNAKCEN